MSKIIYNMYLSTCLYRYKFSNTNEDIFSLVYFNYYFMLYFRKYFGKSVEGT